MHSRTLAFVIAAGTLGTLCSCSDSDSTIHLQPGQSYTINKSSGLVLCPGKWSDYDRIIAASESRDARDRNAALGATIMDGGTTFIGGDAFTVLGFGSGGEAPVHIRSRVNGERCWLSDEDIQGLIKPD